MAGLMFRVYPEPIDSWTNFMGENLLKRMYEEPKEESSWLGRMQLKVIHDLMRQDEEIRNVVGASLCVQERDLEAVGQVFLPLNRERFHPIDYRLLMDMAKFGRDMNTGENMKKSIYLDCDSRVAYERMQQRAREEERNMTFEEYQAMDERMGVLKETADIIIDVTHMTEKDVLDFVKRILTTDEFDYE